MQAILNATRMYSSQATKMIRPQIAFFGLEGSYTNAVYSAAAKSNCLDVVESDLKKLNETIEKDAAFREFLFNPLIKVNQKKDILRQVMSSKLGANEVTINLVHAMTENRRLKHLPGVTRNYIKAMQVSRGEISCTVTTAKPVTDEATKKEIIASLKGFTNNKLTVTMAVDPALIGGMVVDFNGEHYIDMSVRSKVKMYADLIQQSA